MKIPRIMLKDKKKRPGLVIQKAPAVPFDVNGVEKARLAALLGRKKP